MKNRRQVLTVLCAGALAPLAAFAQRPVKIPRIGFLGPSSAASIAGRLEGLREGLRELGYVEGKTIFIDYRWAEGDYSRLPAIADELVRLNVDVIVTHTTNGARAAKQATTKIPIVMAAVGDVVAGGLVTNLARPGGNITGLSFFQPEVGAKRLEIIKEVAPRSTQFAFLYNPDSLGSVPIVRSVENAASLLKIDLQLIAVRVPDDYESAFLAMKKKGVNAVVADEEQIFIANVKRVAGLAAKHRIALIGSIESAEAGGLIGNGVNVPALFRRAAYFIDKILKGAKPGDIPVEQPTKFELIVNMKSAKALGVKIPQTILVRATKVIE